MIHGELKGVRDYSRSPFTIKLTPSKKNILVDLTGHARITDIGLTAITQNLDSKRRTVAENGDSARWIAPEILDDRGTRGKEADVFSFAMVMIEVRQRQPADVWRTIHLYEGFHRCRSVQ